MEGKRILLVGLGNPGKRYAKTRHNAGFKVIDRIAELRGADLKDSSKFEGEMGKFLTETGEFFLLKPQTFMNLSGRSVQKAMVYYRIGPSEVVIALDDIAIPFGEIRFRKGGSAGGHNGLKSVEECLGTREIPRLRIGIDGSDYLGRNLDDYVLSDFSSAEECDLPLIIDRGAKALLRLEREGMDEIMNDVNTKIPEKGQEKNHERKETKPL